MSAHYQPLLSHIHAEWTQDDWVRFSNSASVPNLLTTLHEAAHWLQRQTLVGRALHLVTVRALLEDGAPRSAGDREALNKVIACKRLLAPLSEGLALYAQFDYFPANFYVGAGDRSPYDALVEFLVARRGFEAANDDTNLADAAWKAIVAARMSGDALIKKRRLLDTPFLCLEDHITGYLLVKASIARVRSSPGTIYLHDGHLVPLIASLFYSCPPSVQAILDPDVSAADAIDVVSRMIRERVAMMLDADAMAALVSATRGRYPDFEHAPGLDSDEEAFTDAEARYGRAYDGMFDHHIRTSPSPLTGDQLLASPHFGRVFTADVTIEPDKNGPKVVFRATGQQFVSLSSVSPRAAYGWIRWPETPVPGRLVEAIAHLHGLEHDFFRISLVSHENGLAALTHDTTVRNIGYYDLGDYLKNAYRIDEWLARIERDVEAFERAEFACASHVDSAKEIAYREHVSGIVTRLSATDARTGHVMAWVNGRSFFATTAELIGYVALSLAARLGDFAFEYRGDLVRIVRDNLRRLPIGVVESKHALRFISHGRGLCSVQQYRGRKLWWSFNCLL